MTPSLRTMSFNVRFDFDPPPHRWRDRRPLVRDMLAHTQPDLIGTQEALFPQLKDLQHDLPHYRWIGQGREGGSRDEFMAIFYRQQRFEPLAFDFFWLSDTPKLAGSKTWGNKHPRLVAWVQFHDRQTDQHFVFLTTHLDNAVQHAREQAAKAILKLSQQFEPTLPLLLTGDFNANPDNNPVYDLLITPNGFQDVWTEAQSRSPQAATYHEYQGIQPDQPRIDWILRRGPIKTHRAEVVTFSRNGQFPSDHFPLIADLSFDK